MAHSDTLIFLTNISWIFFLFLLSYFFFVLFFLPTFYKKVRARTLIRADHQRLVLVLLSNSIVGSLLFICELTKSFFFDLAALVRTLNASFAFLNSPFFIKFNSTSGPASGSAELNGFWLGGLSAEPRKLVIFSNKFN